MDKRVRLFFTAATSCFVLGILVAFLSNYRVIGGSAFDELMAFDFYKEKIAHGFLFGLFWVYITWWSDKKQNSGKL